MNRKENKPDSNAIAPFYLHVARFFDKIVDSGRLELLGIQRLKTRSEGIKETLLDQETFSEGSEEYLDLQDKDGWSEELEDD